MNDAKLQAEIERMQVEELRARGWNVETTFTPAVMARLADTEERLKTCLARLAQEDSEP